MNTHMLHNVLKQVRDRFLASFPSLSDADLHVIFEGQSETLLEVLQRRYGYSRDQAKAAWNDFVLRYVDGRGDEPSLNRCYVYSELTPPTGAYRRRCVRLPSNPGRRIA